MIGALRRYADWLHMQWPDGDVSRLPRVDENYQTNVDGVYVVGDLAGVPLLKFSLDSGTKAVRHIANDASFSPGAQEDAYDVVILGAGASGMAAAREAENQGLSYVVLEATKRFATIKDFQMGKPIYTYPKSMTPAGDIQVSAPVKEALVDELESQTGDIPVQTGEAQRIDRQNGRLEVVCGDDSRIAAQRVVVAIGRSGAFRELGAPGEDLDHVHHRLHDPSKCDGKSVTVVGGGDSALEAAIALTEAGANVTLSYRRDAFFRPKEENIDRVYELAAYSSTGSLTLKMNTEVERIEEEAVGLRHDEGGTERIPARKVFAMIGREAPLDFFRRSGIEIRNDWGTWPKPDIRKAWTERSTEPLELHKLPQMNWSRIGAMLAFTVFMVVVYSWQEGGGWLNQLAESANAFPFWLGDVISGIEPSSLVGVTLTSMQTPSFYFTMAYSIIVVVYGYRRIQRRKTPYITWQTTTLAAIQVVPLFLLPEIFLPYLGGNELLPAGLLDGLFPESDWATHGREYWRAYGFILAWPLLVYNVFTHDPLFWWLAICFVQTFVLIPGMIYFWGKGAYCGWICTCGALAETLGDEHRDKMPHGEWSNKLNFAGQIIMVIAFVMLFWRIGGWIWPGGWMESTFNTMLSGGLFGFGILSYAWFVDVLLAGMIALGVYFWLSGRVWCRFFCPLAALMHIYHRFSRFRILADKDKCISCNVCTSVCHQGIDVMSFAQQGKPMEDPQCVRCSACVQSCPTGVLSFGQVDTNTGQVISRDSLEASLARIQEEAALENGQRQQAQGS